MWCSTILHFFVLFTILDLNVPIVLDANLAYELSKAFAWVKENEFEIKELSEYYGKIKLRNVPTPIEQPIQSL